MAVATATFSLIDMNDAIVSGTAPANPTVGTLWLDTSVTPNMMKKWGGSSWVDIGELDPNYSDTIENINKSINDITSDSVIDYTERKALKDVITNIIGYVIADTATTLPAVTTLDSSGKGEFASLRKQALNVGMVSVDSTYTNFATQYNNLKTYLESLTPVDVWDVSIANKDKVINVIKATFRDKFLQYTNALNSLKEAVAAKQKANSDNAQDSADTTYNSFYDPLFSKGFKFWSNSYIGQTVSAINPNASYVEGQDGSHGGDTLTITGQSYVFSKNAIPVDVNRTYQVRFRVKQLVDATAGAMQVYAGVATLDKDFNALTGGAGTHRYCAVAGVGIKSADGWREFKGTITGVGDLANQFRAGTVYVRPMFIVNYSGGNGKAAVETLEFLDITEAKNAQDIIDTNSSSWSDAAQTISLWKYNGQKSLFNGDVIATGTLFAKSLFLSDWTNLIENPDFESDTVGALPFGFNTTSGVRVQDISTFANGNGSRKALEFDAYTSGNNSIYASNIIPVQAGESFYLSAMGRYLNTAGNGTGRIGFLRYDAKKQPLNLWDNPVTWSGTKTMNFTTLSGNYTVPSGTAYLQFYATFSNNGETTNKFYLDNIVMRRRATAELIVDGVIEGRHIKALSVEFDKLQGGTATLGGANNVNGQLIVLDANGDLAVGLNTLDDDGVTYYSGFQNVIAESLYISKSIKAPNIVETTTDVINLYVDPINGNDDNPGTSWAAGPLATIQEAVNRLPKVLSHDVRIQMHYSNASEVYENVLVQGFTGSGALTIDFQNTSNVLYGSFKFMYSTVNTVINSGKFIATANQSPVYAEGVARLAMNNSIVDAKSLTAYAVYISNSFADLRGCQFYNGTNSQVIAAYGARADVIDCTGSGGTNGVRAYRSSIVAGTGTAPTGSSKNALGDQGGQCTGTWTYPNATAPSTPAPATYTTVTVTANSGNSWRSGFGGQWYGGNVRQALWTSSYGRYMGYWFFGTQFNQFNGKTITKVRIWAQRYNGGGSSASKNARFVLHGYQSQPSSSSQPTFYGGLSTGTAYTAGFKWGEAKWIDATAAFKNHINQTSVYGIGLWMYSDSPYMIFNNNLKVEVTYKN